MAQEELLFYDRHKIVNFIALHVGDTTFLRMKGLTSGENSANAETDETKYIDEPSKRKRTTGYSKEISYEADRIIGDPIHDFLNDVEELEQTNVNVEIATIDFARPKKDGYYATKRVYSVIPDSSGDDENKYTLSGTFGANGEIIKGYAMSTDGFKTSTFTPDSETAEKLVTFNVTSADGQIHGAKIVIDQEHTIYTDVNGIAEVMLSPASYKVNISKDGYTAQSNVAVDVSNKEVYKAITLVKPTTTK